eukprot:scaffold149294_cov24-Tisochrysis_lutea.AAC.1
MMCLSRGNSISGREMRRGHRFYPSEYLPVPLVFPSSPKQALLLLNYKEGKLAPSKRPPCVHAPHAFPAAPNTTAEKPANGPDIVTDIEVTSIQAWAPVR